MDKIIFFYPSKVIGGAEYLFARLAKYLQEQEHKKVYYIDYSDGFIINNKDFESLNFIEFKDGEKVDLEFKEGILINPISNIYRFTDYINIKNSDIKLLFWSLHPYNIIHVMPEAYVCQNFNGKINKFFLKLFGKYNYDIYYNLLKYCSDLNACYYMDNNNYSFNKTIFENAISEKYLPIASIRKNIHSDGKIINNNEINIGILGRLCQEKTYALLNVLENLNKLKTNKKIKAHIIGDGEFKHLIKPEKYKNVKIIHAGTICNEKLDNYLINNVDVLFSMGTSLLEGAALKIPTIPIPYSYRKYFKNKFLYLNDMYGYNVGLNLIENDKVANITFYEIIEDIYTKDLKRKFGQECYEYFTKNHSLESVASKLLDCIDTNNLNYKLYSDIKSKLNKPNNNKNIIYKLLRGYFKHVQK